MTPPDYTLPEAETREFIDQKLISAGWVIQDKKRINLYESSRVVVAGTHATPASASTDGTITALFGCTPANPLTHGGWHYIGNGISTR